MGLSYDDGGKGGTHIGALINLKKKRRRVWASRNWRRILFSTGWAVLALVELSCFWRPRRIKIEVAPDLARSQHHSPGGKTHFVTSAACIGLHTLPYHTSSRYP